MNKAQKLLVIKLFHTLIWIFMVSVIFYVLYSGISGRINILTWISAVIIIMEGAVLALFKMSCPLTILARKYSYSTKDNFDIYLPVWIARYNKQIFTLIFAIGIIIVCFRLL